MSKKLIDMHMHTNYSDGELSPDELIKLAIENNIGTMAITDHDTINGVKQVNSESDYIKNSGIEIYNGIELTASVPKGRMHILGYDYDINNDALNQKMHELRDNSLNRVLSIMEQLKRDYGIIFTYDEIKSLINANHNLGRPDLARLLIKNRIVKNVQEAFDKYLVATHEKVRDTNKGLQYEECLDLIRRSGGVSILAHPKSLELEDKEFIKLLEDMIACGLQGIEVYHSNHSGAEMNYYLDIAKKYNLLISAGSDFHGKSVKPDVEIGTGINNNLKIKRLSLTDELKMRHYK